MGGNKRGREEEKDDDEEEDSLAVREQEERRKERESVLEAQMRKKDEELKELREELRNLSPPTPLWKIVTDKQYKDIFETHILKKLDELSFRVFREVNTESRDACRRSGRKMKETLKVATEVWSRYPTVSVKMTRKLKGKEAQHRFCSEAARTGNLALVRWLREVKKFDWNELTINAAAGHLHIVTYCMEQSCPRSRLACALAAEFGHLDILKYLHENGAPWDSWTCYFARENNHLECLNYAKENGCPDTN